MKNIFKDSEKRMEKTVSSLVVGLKRLRTGRAHPSLLEQISVDYYGSSTQLAQMANVSAEDSKTLSVTVWDTSMVDAVEKSILESNLGLTPNTAGSVIRIPIPAMTEERRKDLIKVLKTEAEQSKVAIRNIRRDGLGKLKELVKDKEISEDDERKGSGVIQKFTDNYVEQVDVIIKQKEEEILEI